MIKIDEADELTKLALCLGLWKIPDGFFREWGDAIAVDVVSEEVQLRNAKDAFVRVDDDAVSRETLEDSA